MEVPFSTPTALDKQEEVRKLNLEIAKLSSAHEIGLVKVKGAEAAASDAEGRVATANGIMATLELLVGGAIDEVHRFLDEHKNVVRSTEKILTDCTTILRKIAGRVDELAKEAEALEEKKKILLDDIARENEIASRQRDDLDVYHRRILAAAEKYLPDQKIVI